MTYYEKLANGTKEDLINELVLVITWARGLSNRDWRDINSVGLEQFVRDTLDNEVD